MIKGSRLAAAVAAVALAGTLGACSSGTTSTGGGGGGGGGGSTTTTGGSGGGGGGSNASGGSYAPGGTLQVLMGTKPDSLDPDYGYTAQSSEATWLVYTPLLTYTSKNGQPGTQIIPGLATALPVVSDGGKTYTMTIRKGLKFSNGAPLVASDFALAIERSIKIQWGGSSFFSTNIVGGTAYLNGKASSISGIQTDNATGKIVIHLVAPYGAFDNVLSFPAAAPVPAGTPMKVLSADPPAGIGPYMFTSVNGSTGDFTMAKNPSFASFNIPNIPTGYVNKINVTIDGNNITEAQQVIDNQADEFDWSDTIPPAYLKQVQGITSRYKSIPLASTFYFFMNTRTAPFNNIKAREAVNLAISRTALSSLASGQLTPACYFLPPGIPGHVDGSCPFGSPDSTGSSADIAKAKALVKAAGDDGMPVTVWSETRQPRQNYSVYLTSVLNKIGFKATVKVIADGVYFQTIGSAKTNPQIGMADWFQDFPNPVDFYLLLSKAGIQSVNNENFGNVDDPKIEAALAKLNPVPATQLSSVASQWQALEKYVSSQYYMAPFGNLTGPFFLSDRVDFSKAVFQPLFGDDWASFELKK